MNDRGTPKSQRTNLLITHLIIENLLKHRCNVFNKVFTKLKNHHQNQHFSFSSFHSLKDNGGGGVVVNHNSKKSKIGEIIHIVS